LAGSSLHAIFAIFAICTQNLQRLTEL